MDHGRFREMSAELPKRSSKRVSPSIRFIDHFLSQRPPEELTAVLLGQLDTFNRIGTTFGTEKSREFCADYTEMLRLLLPQGTPIIRLSGRRFAVLVTLDSMAAVADAAMVITEEHQPKMQVGDDSFLVDVTVGVAVHPVHADDADSLFRRADLALKNAQDEDLSYEIYRADTTRQQATLWKLESDLKQAIADQEMDVYYQPKLNLREQKISGVEALVRWQTENGRILSPDDFIPIAERSGMIGPLTWMVFDKVRDAVRAWNRFSEPFGIAINIAPQTANHPEFYGRLKSLREELVKYNICLSIELTEDSLLQSDKKSLENLLKIRELGVDLAIDDFGKGYSSLTYLKQVPAAEIKIDKSFIEVIGLDETDQHIVKAVVDIAHALGMRVVAEGVDSEESLAMVRKLGCEMAQGYLISRPMRSGQLLDWIAGYHPTLSLHEEVDPAAGLIGLKA